jgi:hypothetical protein
MIDVLIIGSVTASLMIGLIGSILYFQVFKVSK